MPDNHNHNRPAMRYYDLKRHWTKKITPHLTDKGLNDLLVTDFNKFTCGRWLTEFNPGQLPDEFESCDWRCSYKAPYPRFWRYVKHAACHWIVNFTLKLAMLVEPSKKWRILTSPAHSTVWDGDKTLFDFNFNALGISAEECYKAANKEELEPGSFMEVEFAAPYVFELNEYNYLKNILLNEVPSRYVKLSNENKSKWLCSFMHRYKEKHKGDLIDKPLMKEFLNKILPSDTPHELKYQVL